MSNDSSWIDMILLLAILVLPIAFFVIALDLTLVEILMGIWEAVREILLWIWEMSD